MNSLLQDIRLAFRKLGRTRVFSFFVILTLALGIGPNTAIFSVVNALLLRPFPYEEADRLALLWNRLPGSGPLQPGFSKPELVDLREQTSSFEAIGAWGVAMVNLTGGDEPRSVQAGWISSNLLTVLRQRPALGRAFLVQEHTPGNDHVVLMTDAFWRGKLGADPGILGRVLTIDGEPYTVVGVMSPEFQLPLDYEWSGNTDLLMPLLHPAETDKRRARFLYLAGRLRPEVSLDNARAELQVIGRGLQQLYPSFYPETDWSLEVNSLSEEIVGDLRPALSVLLVAVGFVLLIVCANLANLILAQAASRESETALRTAIGAGRRRLIQQFFVESILLAVLGGGLGVLLASWGMKVLIAAIPGNVPRLEEVGIDLRVLMFALLLSIAIGIVLGLFPVLQIVRGKGMRTLLREGGKGSVGGGRRLLRRLLVVAETALALVLLIGAGLMIKSFRQMQQVDLGFEPDRVVGFPLNLIASRYREEATLMRFIRQVEERVAALPGVEHAGGVSHLPFRTSPPPSGVEIEEGISASGGPSLTSTVQVVTPGYFQALGIPRSKGRGISFSDDAGSPAVVVVNETAARRFWPGKDPIGKRLRLVREDAGDSAPSWLTVVGVMGDIKQMELDAEIFPEIYIPYPQMTAAGVDLLDHVVLTVRAQGEPESLIPALKAAIWEFDRDLPLGGVLLRESVARKAARPRFAMMLLTFFAGLALMLAAIGIYGVLSYSVAQRRQEIGVRMALGADRLQVVRMVLRESLIQVLVGLGIGLAASFWLTRFLVSLLFGVSALDGVTFFFVPLVLLVIALLASYLPARRATRVDPVMALRYE